MAHGPLRSRQTGASAVIGPTGFPLVTSATGGSLQIVTGASQPGFNPLDLFYAALAACMAMSARYAASQRGIRTEISVTVTGEKAAEGPERVTHLFVDIHFATPIDPTVRDEIVRLAEHEICTISNTLHGQPEMITRVVP